MPLDPIVDQMLKQMAEAEAPALIEMSPADARVMFRAMNEEGTKAELDSVSDNSADGVPIRIYRPSLEENLPCLVYFHGGGWVIGDLETHDVPCRLLAKESGCVVIAVDYRLAPEHPFPAPLDDCYQATEWVTNNAALLNIDKNKIAVGGDSAGGNLAASVCIRARDEGGPKLVHQLLIYPVTDIAMDTESYNSNADGYMLTRESMVWFWNHYVGDKFDDSPLASPLKTADLSNLPTATVLTAEFDPLRDEGEAYGENLKSAGVTTLIKRYDGLIHGFVGMTDVLEGARSAVRLMAAELQNSFGDKARK
ncbi:MAG: alpha/beta hydrolase [Pseudomonadales bacterium]|jgi:acetyl esterase|nr:alpha/beta hydrolase [Pseudomonadales bacterium]MDP7357806.1 alpha/beta hydrolase [Pseudomonadales bacterium]MDP7596807.1 alpha/beta hydrolase [Pseudomonadales bacterium]HJN51185.1 alpha/beta hydrolase [Pseudomonadales bacterium]